MGIIALEPKRLPTHEDDEVAGETKPVRSAFDNDNLDSFLGQLHGSSATGEENGMPSLQWLKDNFQTKSGAIRYLFQKGYEPKKIALHLGLKYQHVYNVTHQNLKRGPNEVFLDKQWQCPHTHAQIIIDVIARKGERDPDSSRILYRVCSECAKQLIPGVTEDALLKTFPGLEGPTR